MRIWCLSVHLQVCIYISLCSYICLSTSIYLFLASHLFIYPSTYHLHIYLPFHLLMCIFLSFLLFLSYLFFSLLDLVLSSLPISSFRLSLFLSLYFFLSLFLHSQRKQRSTNEAKTMKVVSRTSLCKFPGSKSPSSSRPSRRYTVSASLRDLLNHRLGHSTIMLPYFSRGRGGRHWFPRRETCNSVVKN